MSTTARVIAAMEVRRFAHEQAAHRLARVVYEVQRFLAIAPNAEESIEAIHQFRVSTRRFRAVLDTFRDVFPRRARKRIRQTIRDAFSIAGEARNRDITMELIASSKVSVPRTLVPVLRAQRAEWELRLRQVLHDWTRSDFSADWRQDLELP
jgi:CHAD domain-containing protein